jgi:hypothetical protein
MCPYSTLLALTKTVGGNVKQKMSKENNTIKDLIETGSEITGSISGAVIGGLVAGPIGLVIGGVSGPLITKALKNVGSDLKKRFTSPREEIRMGAAFTFAIDKIQRNLESGEEIRRDGFFDDTINERSDSEEILEGTILNAQKEYEERKVKFLGNLYANISTNTEISREHANQLLRTANNLSYRQFCILQLLFIKSSNNQIIEEKVRGLEDRKVEKVDIIAELRDLQQRGLITVVARWNDVDDNSSPVLMDDIEISKNGIIFTEMLSLNELTNDDLESLNREMKVNL